MRFWMPEGESLHRLSDCANCLMQIGGRNYVRVYQRFDEPISVPPVLAGLMEPVEGVIVTVHAECVRPGDEILS